MEALEGRLHVDEIKEQGGHAGCQSRLDLGLSRRLVGWVCWGQRTSEGPLGARLRAWMASTRWQARCARRRGSDGGCRVQNL